MTSGDLENRSRSTKFNRDLALLKVNLNMKAMGSYVQTDGGRENRVMTMGDENKGKGHSQQEGHAPKCWGIRYATVAV